MGNPILNGSITHEYQNRFGQAPGAQEPKLECARWEQISQELLAERDRLRGELECTRKERDQYLQTLNVIFRPTIGETAFSREEILSQVGNKPSLRELLTEPTQ